MPWPDYWVTAMLLYCEILQAFDRSYHYQDDEVVVVASERPAIQTVFNVPYEAEVKELDPGHAIIVKKNGSTSLKEILAPVERKACSFERIYFSRGSDKEIYQERKMLGKLLFPQILKSIENDIKRTVFSYIPNTAETSFFGMVKEAQNYLNKRKEEANSFYRYENNERAASRDFRGTPTYRKSGHQRMPNCVPL